MRSIKAKGLQVGTKYVMEDDYLTALALEKSGFRGMRLIVDRRILPNAVSFNREWEGFHRPLHCVASLKNFAYPTGGEFADVLWMTESPDRYGQLKGIMASRYKESTRDPDEFMQASWTRVTFDQVDTLVWKCSQSYEAPSPAGEFEEVVALTVEAEEAQDVAPGRTSDVPETPSVQ
jgi:hypothetical protein